MKAYATAYARGIRPEPDLTVSQWADEHRILDQAASSEPGKWRTDRTPYLRGIMDMLSVTSPEDVIVFMKGAQIGATEAANNFLGYVIHHAPGPMLYVMPTVDAAKRASKQRISPMLDAIPEVRAKVAVPRARDSGNTLFQKDYPGGTLILTGSNSSIGLRSMPIRYLFLDEIDGYPTDLEGEGSPIQLAMRRTATFKRNRKIFMVSTPTIKGLSSIEQYFDQSDQRYFFVPCPDCGEFQTITWSRIIFRDKDPSTTHMACEHCGVEIAETNKTRMLEQGEWRATAEGQFVGFHLSSLYSPAGWYSWSDAVADFLQAKKSGPAVMKTFANTVLGETWEEQGDQVEPYSLLNRREDYATDLPIQVKTIGVDIQKDRIELIVVGWGVGEESWCLEYIILSGDTAAPTVWGDLDNVLKEIAPDVVCIDSGYNTQIVYDWVKKRRFCFAVKGIAGMGIPLIDDPARRARRLRRRRSHVYQSRVTSASVSPEPVGVDQAKVLLYSRLQIDTPGPGCVHFPISEDFDDEFFAQLTSEKLVTRYTKGRPRQEWVLTRPRNEALDAFVYALAAVRLGGFVLKKSVETEPQDARKRAITAKKRRPVRQVAKGGAWL